MWVVWWISFIVVMVTMITCILHLKSKFSENSASFKAAFFVSMGLFILLPILAIIIHNYQPPWEGTGKITKKEYFAPSVKREFNGKIHVNRLYPECYGLFIVPSDSETAKIKFTSVCVSQASWDKVKEQKNVTIEQIDGKAVVK